MANIIRRIPGRSGPQQDLPSALLSLAVWLSPVSLSADGEAILRQLQAFGVRLGETDDAAPCWRMRRCNSAAFHLGVAHSTLSIAVRQRVQQALDLVGGPVVGYIHGGRLHRTNSARKGPAVSAAIV